VDSDVCAQPIDDERSEGRPARYACPLDARKLDPDAAKVVRRLVRHGYEAYLVGGCVRDLLLGRTPKDFDVATSAQPDDVQRLFRNCRIIGRRFRLAHVFFSGGKVIETATFRRSPTSEEKTGDQLLIRRDNFFGRADEDAVRRDFTINALFYDLEAKEVIDWCGGVEDLQRRAVRTIGDPIVRFLEDPVRMLRAIRFSARCDLGMTPNVYHAIVQCRGALAMAARPRLFEEVLRLLRGGASQPSIWLAWETGVLDVLLPEVSTYLYDRPSEDGTFWELLSDLDRWTDEQGESPDDIVLWTCLLFEPLLEACASDPDSSSAAMDFLEPIIERLNVPRRVADAVRRIVAQLPRMYTGRAGRFSRTPLYAPASEVLALLGDAHPKLDAFLETAPKKKRRRKATRA
jgi:poly(A) polymerase